MRQNKMKYLVVLDWDGTVTKLPFDTHGTWGSMDIHLLDEEGVIFTRELREHMLEFRRRDLLDRHSQLLWFELSVAAWVKRGLNRANIQQVFGNCNSNLRPGFVDSLRWLKQEREHIEIIVVINSFGIVQFIETALQGLGAADLVDHIAATPLNFNGSGEALACDRDKILLPDDKHRVTEEMMTRFGVSEQNTIGIGDSSGDREIAPRRLLLAFDQNQVDACGKYFEDHVISDDWSGPRTWLEKNFGF